MSLKPVVRSINIQIVDNGFLLEVNSEVREELVFLKTQDQEMELLKKICEALDFGPDIVDWSESETETETQTEVQPQEGGNTTKNKISVSDI